MFATTPSERFMTTACRAVISDDSRPKKMPSGETAVPSRKMPTKKPAVTTAQAYKMWRDGRAAKRRYEVKTVSGSTRPRTTW